MKKQQMLRVGGLVLLFGVSVIVVGCGQSQTDVAAETDRQKAAELAQAEEQAKAQEDALATREQQEEEMARQQEELALIQAEEERQREDQVRMEELKEKVTALLKDPSSAQFQNLRLTSAGALCGEVNARNAFGGYVGFRGFVASEEKTFIDDPDALEHLVYESTARLKGCE